LDEDTTDTIYDLSIHSERQSMWGLRFILIGLCLINVSCKESVIELLPPNPTATLSTPVIAGGYTALNSSGTATLTVTFTNIYSTSLSISSGSTVTAPAGLSVSETGASCSNVDITAVSITSATIEVTGCTGDGTVTVAVEAGVVVGENTSTNLCSVIRTITLHNKITDASVSMNASIVAVYCGDNIATATFSERVQNLSPTNANGEFTVTGCTTTDPDVSIVMSVNGSNESVATATLDSGSCADSDVVSVQLNLDTVTDNSGNAGLIADNPAAELYTVVTNVPVASLATAVYAGGTSAINSSATADLTLTYTNADSTTLVDGTGTSAAPPSGLTVVENGATCTNVDIANSSNTGADISVSGCTGDGSITVRVNAATASNMGVHDNAASSVRTVVVQNALPTATLAALSNPGGADGSNTITATFNQMVQTLSGTEFSISGCSTTDPTVSSVVMSVSAGASVATVTVDSGTCTLGDTVSVSLDTSAVTNLAGDVGAVNPAPETYTVGP